MNSKEYPPLRSASQVAAAFFAALHDARWDDAVAMVDEQVRAEFHEAEVADLLARAQHRAEFRTMRDGGTGGVGYSPDSVANAALLGEFGEMPVLGIEGVGTIADYAALPPADLLARHLEAANGPVYRLAPSILARVKKHIESQPGGDVGAALTQHVRPTRPQVIGEVIEMVGADRIAHVVYRREKSQTREVEGGDGTDPFEVEVLHLRDRGGWRVALSRSDFILFGPPWFELDYDWEPGAGFDVG